MSKSKALTLGLGVLLIPALVISYVVGQANEVGSRLSTRLTVQPGDTVVQQVSGLLPKFTVHDLIQHSDAIVIGTVTDILAAKQGTWNERPVIYTDVIVEVDRYLYGEPTSERIAIQVWGGRIGDTVMLVEDEPVFTLGEDVVVFLFRPPYELGPPIPDMVDILSYYRVTGACLGKFTYLRLPDAAVNNDLVQELPGQTVAISAIVNQIAGIKGKA